MRIKKFNEDIEIKKRIIDSGLKMKTEMTHYVDWSDLDNYVMKVYGGHFDFASDVESSNDTTHTYTVKGKVDKWDQEAAESIRKGEYPDYCSRIILEVLCEDGHIPTGNYNIRVSW